MQTAFFDALGEEAVKIIRKIVFVLHRSSLMNDIGLVFCFFVKAGYNATHVRNWLFLVFEFANSWNDISLQVFTYVIQINFAN